MRVVDLMVMGSGVGMGGIVIYLIYTCRNQLVGI